MKVGIFVDGDNFYWVQKNNLGWDCDMAKLKQYIESNYGEVAIAKYYMSVDPDGESQDRRRGLKSALATMGFSVEARTRKEIRDDANGDHRLKTDVDVVLALDVYHHMIHQEYGLGTIVLVTGDSDFFKLLELAEANKKRLILMCTKGAIASDMREKAGMNYVDVRELEDKLKREGG